MINIQDRERDTFNMQDRERQFFTTLKTCVISLLFDFKLKITFKQMVLAGFKEDKTKFFDNKLGKSMLGYH